MRKKTKMNDSDKNKLIKPDIIKLKLILIALFIAVYENLKETINTRVKTFFLDGLEKGKPIYDEYYEKEILGKAKKGKNPNLSWFKECNAITDEAIYSFEKITDLRNELVHKMSYYIIYNSLPKNFFPLYETMLNLFKKIDKWQINEFEIPIGIDYEKEDYDPNEVQSVNFLFLEIIEAIALNKDYKHLEKELNLILNNKFVKEFIKQFNI